MTNKEAVIAKVYVGGYNPDALDLAIIESGLDPDGEYSTTDKDIVTLAAIDVLEGMLIVERIQEGGYSITYSIEGVKARLAFLRGEKPLVDGTATIRNKSFMW